MVVHRKAIGEFPPIPAPDDTWRLSHEDPPLVGEKVEICFARRKTPTSKVEYHQTVGTMIKRSNNEGGHTWNNKDDQTLVFNPCFWRPIGDSK